MTQRQIEEQEYQFLQARKQVADFVESIYNDPQLSRDAKILIKRKYPNLSIPDLDIESRVAGMLQHDRNERDEAERKKKEAAEDEAFKAKRKETQEAYGFTDEAMTELEDMMRERNVGDYDVAATYKASKNPKTTEPTFSSNRWNHKEQAGWADIVKDPERWAENEILGAIRRDEARARQGRF